eukprot:m.93079 g.93079  ORF g.93079 m.93079 type:complete len:124 (+) comp13381_c0_seq1:777-1148(+)
MQGCCIHQKDPLQSVLDVLSPNQCTALEWYIRGETSRQLVILLLKQATQIRNVPDVDFTELYCCIDGLKNAYEKVKDQLTNPSATSVKIHVALATSQVKLATVDMKYNTLKSSSKRFAGNYRI